MTKLILKTQFSLGDVVMMTAAVRDLHRCYPNQFQTDVRTHFPEVWENNPFLTCLSASDPEAQVIDCRYPLINHADFRPYHCLHGYIDFLNQKLGLRIVPTEFRGDIHLSAEERQWASQVHELAGSDIPFWIIAAGGKFDISIKWWSTERYQKVVDHFRGRLAFVQVGEWGHHHPKLQHTIDLRGQTSVRELIRLVHHAQGCLCSVTALMHLAAAVETRPGFPPNRPCVVVAGGREPANWEAYPHHQFIHTGGALACCSQGGCWRSRVVPLGDGDERDQPEHRCCDVVDHLPRCMHLITPDEVVDKIEWFVRGGALRYLTSEEAAAARTAIRASLANTYDLHSLNGYNVAAALRQAIDRLPPYPGGFEGRGVVICGGGLRYFPCAWVCVHMLRQTGCRLPVQLWYEGPAEMDVRMIRLMRRAGVECVDARKLEKRYPRRVLGGWELKPYAMLHCPFKEVLLLDADNVPVQNPAGLFDSPQYRETGSIFWPDYGSLPPDAPIWRICDLPYRNEPEFETGQILVDKEKCWRALNLTFWFNDHSDFFFRYIHGDKETFHLAWRKLEQPYTMVSTPIHRLSGTMCQHDLEGNRLFQHRNLAKWQVFGRNRQVRGFRLEKSCLKLLKELEGRWDGHIRLPSSQLTPDGFLFRGGTCDRNIYHDVCERNEYALPERFAPGDLVIDVGAHVGSFSYACLQRGAGRVLAFEPERENYRLAMYNLRPFRQRVRLHQKAVWRSDRHPGVLLHSGYSVDDFLVNTGGGTVLLPDEVTPHHPRKEVVSAVGLDQILRRYPKVALLKLDCEGSEWPILFTSSLLGRVERICGEYHELQSIPTAAQVDGYRRYTKKELVEFLRSRYKSVRVQVLARRRLGHFWAEDPLRA